MALRHSLRGSRFPSPFSILILIFTFQFEWERYYWISSLWTWRSCKFVFETSDSIGRAIEGGKRANLTRSADNEQVFQNNHQPSACFKASSCQTSVRWFVSWLAKRAGATWVNVTGWSSLFARPRFPLSHFSFPLFIESSESFEMIWPIKFFFKYFEWWCMLSETKEETFERRRLWRQRRNFLFELYTAAVDLQQF